MTDLADRYGTRHTPQWLWWVVAAVGIAIGVAWAAWIAVQPRPVQAELRTYEVVSDTQIDATIEVFRQEAVEVTCSVYAQGADHQIVGERTLVVEPTDGDVVRESVSITTTHRAVTAVIRSCEVTD